MTAVAMHTAYPARPQHQLSLNPTAPASSQSPSSQQSRKNSNSGHSLTSSSRVARDGPTHAAVVANGSSTDILSHLHASNGAQHPPLSRLSTANGHANGTTADDASSYDADHRPSTAPGDSKLLVASFDDSDREQPKRRPKPPLLRSRSEHIMRYEEADQAEDEVYDWSARHGFEDHYQSEDIISQLANLLRKVVGIRVSMVVSTMRVVSRTRQHKFSISSSGL
ncbi:hypothetical protein BJ170DRAFT_493195 [Xylariales sp. AK1849]|nr:hypothetical protein BJ170DRAFT_493195 [Xylariales sp. AK1849]